MSQNKIEESPMFQPRYNAQGLIPCITTSAGSDDVLMFAWMNEEALQKTLETGEAHYWSRSRKTLWHKGATSGDIQRVREMRIDCDQDCLWIKVDVMAAQEKACHTGRRSCFYRIVKPGGKSQPPRLEFTDTPG